MVNEVTGRRCVLQKMASSGGGKKDKQTEDGDFVALRDRREVLPLITMISMITIVIMIKMIIIVTMMMI